MGCSPSAKRRAETEGLCNHRWVCKSGTRCVWQTREPRRFVAVPLWFDATHTERQRNGGRVESQVSVLLTPLNILEKTMQVYVSSVLLFAGEQLQVLQRSLGCNQTFSDATRNGTSKLTPTICESLSPFWECGGSCRSSCLEPRRLILSGLREERAE